jgi:putative transposase
VPVSITVDHGTEFTSKALEEWAYQHGVKLDFTHPRKVMENGHIESFNGRLRDECLNVNQFVSLDATCALSIVCSFCAPACPF